MVPALTAAALVVLATAPGVGIQALLAAELETRAPTMVNEAEAAPGIAADLERDWRAQKQRMVDLAEAMPADKYDFKATPAQRSFAEQLLHLAEAHVAMLKRLDPGGKVPAPTLSKDHAREAVVRSVATAYDYGLAVITSDPARNWAAAADDQPSPARAVWAAMNNASNHYGQCVVYLRLNGIVPPASRR
jgi:uncharacterized damage-inducible protein DinB